MKKESLISHRSKSELAGIIIMQEKNIAVLEATIDQQYTNAMNIFNELTAFKNRAAQVQEQEVPNAK